MHHGLHEVRKDGRNRLARDEPNGLLDEPADEGAPFRETGVGGWGVDVRIASRRRIWKTNMR